MVCGLLMLMLCCDVLCRAVRCRAVPAVWWPYTTLTANTTAVFFFSFSQLRLEFDGKIKLKKNINTNRESAQSWR